MANLIDLSGQSFGRWVVQKRHPSGKRFSAKWECRCQCGVVKAVDSYSLRLGKSKSCGCLTSDVHKNRRGEKHHRWRGGRRACKIRDAYGIEPEHYKSLLAAQGDVCAICKQPETVTRLGVLKKMPVDHDHKTGRIRGLLCSRCNTAIGLMQDDADILQSAINYLNAASLPRAV